MYKVEYWTLSTVHPLPYAQWVQIFFRWVFSSIYVFTVHHSSNIIFTFSKLRSTNLLTVNWIPNEICCAILTKEKVCRTHSRSVPTSDMIPLQCDTYAQSCNLCHSAVIFCSAVQTLFTCMYIVQCTYTHIGAIWEFHFSF